MQFYAFDILALAGDDLRKLPLSIREQHLSRLLKRRPNGIFIAPFEQGEIGPDLFRAACDMGLEGMVSKRADRPLYAPVDRRTGSRSRTASIPLIGECGISSSPRPLPANSYREIRRASRPGPHWRQP